MAITITTKIIQVGSEFVAIIPDELVAQSGLKIGDLVEVSFSRPKNSPSQKSK